MFFADGGLISVELADDDGEPLDGLAGGGDMDELIK